MREACWSTRGEASCERLRRARALRATSDTSPRRGSMRIARRLEIGRARRDFDLSPASFSAFGNGPREVEAKMQSRRAVGVYRRARYLRWLHLVTSNDYILGGFDETTERRVALPTWQDLSRRRDGRPRADQIVRSASVWQRQRDLVLARLDGFPQGAHVEAGPLHFRKHSSSSSFTR